MSITMKEIANIVGTSRGTVDRVFNNRGNVNKELEEKILSVAKEHNYVPNTTAKLLVASQKKIKIGVIINSVGNMFFDDVLTGIEKAEREWKNNIEITTKQLKGYNPEDQLSAISQLCELGIEALAITPVDDEAVALKLKELIENGIEIAFINADIENVNRLVMVGANNMQIGKIAGNIALLHLNDKKNIAIVTGSYNNNSNKKRVAGFTQVVKEGSEHQIVDIVENHDNDDMSYNIVKQILKDKSIDLIYFCAGGIIGGLKALEENKQNTKAITVDMNHRIMHHLQSGLVIASIMQDPKTQGYLPIKVLVEKVMFGKQPTKTKIHTENKIIMKYSY